MANRILRDWTDSEKTNAISVHAERFFTRLIMKVDDFGRFYADTRLLKANLFPLLLDSIREADIIRWMAECQKAELIVVYESNGKKYLQINDFKQQLRQKNEKYPGPSNDKQMLSNCIADAIPEEETETKKKQKQETETKVSVRNNVALLPAEISNLESEFSKEELDWIYDKLSNYKLAKGKKYKSDYGAINQWVKDALLEKKEKNSAKKENVPAMSKTQHLLQSNAQAKEKLKNMNNVTDAGS
jgi:hypothetical protein